MESKDLELITQGEFIDQGYRVKTIVIRLLGELQQEELDTHEWNARECYETDEEWRAYRASKEKLRECFKEKIRKMLGVADSKSFVLENTLSEIFNAVVFYTLGEGEGQ